MSAFRACFDNFWRIMKRQKRLTWFTAGYAQAAVIFPIVVVAPRYFAKQIGLGGLMQVVNAFSTVQTSLPFIITSYTDIAGIWPFGRGLIKLGPSRILFLPQRPYSKLVSAPFSGRTTTARLRTDSAG
jgi:ABC-type uncharacterized transport system fused permease/ATPase subunit